MDPDTAGHAGYEPPEVCDIDTVGDAEFAVAAVEQNPSIDFRN